MKYDIIISRLKALSNPIDAAGMKRFGINPETRLLGVSMPAIRRFAKEVSKDHSLAFRLWNSGYHEARILASIIADPGMLTIKEADVLANGFDTWDVCDQTCMNLLSKAPCARKLPARWTRSGKEFVKRAGFTLIAVLAVHDKEATDKNFASFFALIKSGARDERNFVKKAVSWALRQLGKRNKTLNRLAIKTAGELLNSGSGSAVWIAKDALKEFANPKAYIRRRIAG